MKLIITISRWVARFLGIFLLLFFIWFAIQIGSPNLNMMSTQEVKLFIANVIMLLGLVVVWKTEFIGGLLLINGYVFFAIANYSFWNGPVFPIFLFLGIVHLFCWAATVFTQRKGNKFSIKIFLR